MTSPRDYLTTLWSGDRRNHWHPLLLILFLASFFYGLAIGARNLLFRIGLLESRSLSCPVISIGNLTVGGTGKTPIVMHLAAMLKEMGRHPAILSRGYGGTTKAPVNVVSTVDHVLSSPEEGGDEPYLMAMSLKNVPVLTGRSRFLTGSYAYEQLGADTILLDDGFQHRQLTRNLNIALLKADAPFGNGFLIPRGPLRETQRALNRADAVILTGADPRDTRVQEQIRHLHRSWPNLPVLTASYQPKELVRNSAEIFPIAFIKGKKVFAFCGIANPASFRKSLEDAGAEIASLLTFPDHHRYTETDCRLIHEAARQVSAQMVIATEKDGVKLTRHPAFFREVFLLRIGMAVDPEETLKQLIEASLGT